MTLLGVIVALDKAANQLVQIKKPAMQEASVLLC